MVVAVVVVVVVVMDRRHLAGIMVFVVGAQAASLRFVFVVEMGRRHLAGIVVFVVHIFIFFYLLLPAGRRRSIFIAGGTPALH